MHAKLPGDCLHPRTAAALLLRLRPPRQVLVRLAPPSAAASVGSFDSFVRPTFNPKLTPFSIELTAITQVGAGRFMCRCRCRQAVTAVAAVPVSAGSVQRVLHVRVAEYP